MQDSIELPSSQNEEQLTMGDTFNKNPVVFPLNSVISPKGRSLSRFNKHGNSQESLAYSNSTLNKWTERDERSPSLNFTGAFNNDMMDQNTNTLNFVRTSEKSKFNGTDTMKGVMIEFSKISEEDEESRTDIFKKKEKMLNESQHSASKQRIELPNFKSQSPSPMKQPQQTDLQYQYQYLSSENPVKRNYVKITPSNRKSPLVTDHLKSHKQPSQQKTQLSSSRRSSNQSPAVSRSNSRINSKSPSAILNGSLSNSHRKASNSKEKENQFSKTKRQSEVDLKQKIRELEYSLKVQSITTEQLRTKVNVLNELLEQKFLEKNGIDFKLFFGNHHQKDQKGRSQGISRSNVDLYVEMKILERSNHEISLMNSRLKEELNEKIIQIKYLQSQLNSSQRQEKEDSQIQTKDKELDRRKGKKTGQSQEMETLLQFIDKQEELIKSKNTQIEEMRLQFSQLRNHLSLLEEKQSRFEQTERPKMMRQIENLNGEVSDLKQEKVRLEMENNLIKLRLEQTGSLYTSRLGSGSRSDAHEGSLSPSPSKSKDRSGLKTNKPISGEKLNYQAKERSESKSLQQNEDLRQKASKDLLSLTLLQEEELILLKKQRDYFAQQSETNKRYMAQNMQLKIQVQQISLQLEEFKRITLQMQEGMVNLSQ